MTDGNQRDYPGCTIASAARGATDEPCPYCESPGTSDCAHLDEDIAQYLAQVVTRHDYQAREVVFSEGEEASAIGVINDGLAAVVKHTDDGRRQIVGFLTRGDLFGVSATDDYFASVETITAVKASLFPRSAFETAVEQHTRLAPQMIRSISHELSEAADHQVVLGRFTARERIAAFLVGLAQRKWRLEDRGDGLPLPMTRADIADYLGLSIEHVSRGFSQLVRDGIIGLTTPQKVKVLDRPGLERIAHMR
ncbi:MAG: Crp/Fnr family transcriptional regulator [Pseudomonadota bacterium]